MDITELYRQFGIAYAEYGSGDRHATQGWVNCRCPFCAGSAGMHLGYKLDKAYWRCWRCGYHPPIETIVALCRVTTGQARELNWQLWQAVGRAPRRREVGSSKHIRIEKYRRPSDVWRLRPSHARYLASRNFDPEQIASQWFVASTGPAATLGHVDYSNRLFIPILWDDREVSFQTRDTTGKAKVKYKACLPVFEAVHHKHIIYGRPDLWTPTGIAVEGVTDAWRLGPQAFAVFGIEYVTQQVNLIRGLFDRVMVVFDAERQAQKRAKTLAGRLMGAGVDAEVYRLAPGQDPGGMADDDARHLVAEVQRWAS
jgi:hypothetical protein